MLGIPHIWIDSLCIVQDDPQDWLHEASTMADVYKHAVLNIAASSAHNGTRGCFQECDEAYTAHVRISTDHAVSDYYRMQNDLLPTQLRHSSLPETEREATVTHVQVRKMKSNSTYFALAKQLGVNTDFKNNEHPLWNICYRKISGSRHMVFSVSRTTVFDPENQSQEDESIEQRSDMLAYDCVASNFHAQSFIDTPLRKRAWVVQEQLLALRTLHCTTNQLFWSCQELKACE